MKPTRGYKLPSFEKPINNIIGFIFYYRLICVILSVITIVSTGIYVNIHSSPEHHVQNVAYVLTGGSIMIGIFYSILNYEHTHSKFKHEVKNTRDTLTFSTACKMFTTEMMKHSTKVKNFYMTNSHLFKERRWRDVDSIFEKDADIRLSYIIMLNYFEATCIGIEQNIVDEDFLREFFEPIFINYYNRFGTYIEYSAEGAGKKVFKDFIGVSKRWNDER